MCENRLEEVQGATTSSLFPPPLFQDTWSCVQVYSSCVGSIILHASETCPLTKPNLKRLQRNDSEIIRQICNVKPQNIVTIRSNELLVQLGIEDLDLRWYGYVEWSNGAFKTACHVQVDGKRGPRRPKMTRQQLTEREALGCRPS